MNLEKVMESFEDEVRKQKQSTQRCNQYSKYCDFIYYESSQNPGLMLAMRVLKPEKKSYILATTHGWHMSIEDFCDYTCAQSDYLRVEVDMRGRAYSDGEADCNGWELVDIIDAVEYAKQHYKEYLIDTDVVYFEGGSGGGGNAYALACKFPDYFAHISAMCGVTDFLQWYNEDSSGEFRDELDVWIGNVSDKEAYASRSPVTMVQNLSTPITVIHGEKDARIPISHAENFLAAAERAGKSQFIDYWRINGVGGDVHWKNITDEDKKKMQFLRSDARKKHRTPASIASDGKMAVCGYLFTKHFSVVLDDINAVAYISYDLDKDIFEIEGIEKEHCRFTRR